MRVFAKISTYVKTRAKQKKDLHGPFGFHHLQNVLWAITEN